jgi:hypothetical protein
MLEYEMVDECYSYLLNKSGYYTNIVREVPFLSRCIDLVLLTNDEKIITVEFKIKNWREAIEQAKDHMLGADKVYVCLPQKKPSETLVNLLVSEKIGLFLYNPSELQLMREYISAPVNTKKVDLFGSMLLNTTKDIYKKQKVRKAL